LSYYRNLPRRSEGGSLKTRYSTIDWESCIKKLPVYLPILDATCAPSNIRYPQDISLLNESREKLKTIIIRFCKAYGLPYPRMYRRQARKNYLALAKSRKRSPKKIRAAIRKQLSYVKRDIKYLDGFMSDGYAPVAKEIKQLLTIYKVYEQQNTCIKIKSIVLRIKS